MYRVVFESVSKVLSDVCVNGILVIGELSVDVKGADVCVVVMFLPFEKF